MYIDYVFNFFPLLPPAANCFTNTICARAKEKKQSTGESLRDTTPNPLLKI